MIYDFTAIKVLYCCCCWNLRDLKYQFDELILSIELNQLEEKRQNVYWTVTIVSGKYTTECIAQSGFKILFCINKNVSILFCYCFS